jgi:uncharacterized membrane protein
MERKIEQRSILHRLAHIDSHHRSLISVLIAAVAYFSLQRHALNMQLIGTWNVFACTMLVLSWNTILNADPKHFRRTVTLQDTGRSILFILLICATGINFLSVGFLLGPARGLPHGRLEEHVFLSILSVLSSWSLMHTLFTLRYAHHYYTGIEADLKTGHSGGLDFPNSTHPDYLDFAYFSFVIGMTCQVSDVQVTSRHLRRLTLFHGVISFAFNTVVLALGVNVVAGML